MKARSQLSFGSGLPRKLLWGGAAAGVSGVARFVALLLLARHLGSTAFGELAWYLWVAELGAVIVTGGWTQAVTRYTAEYRARGRTDEAAVLAGYLIRRGAVCALMVLPLFAGLLLWASRLESGSAVLAIGLYLAGVGGAFAPAWLQGNQTFGRHTALSLVAGLLLLPGTWIGARYAGVPGALGGFLVAGIPALLIVGRVVFRGGRETLERSEKKRVWRFTFATGGAAAISAIVWMRTEIIFLERFTGSDEVGLYASALVFATALTQVVLLFRGVFLPHFSGLAGAGRDRDLGSAYEDSTFLFAVVLLPACFFGAALAPVVAGLFGESFAQVWPLFALLAIGGAVHIFAAGGALASSLERNTFVFWSACGGAAVFVILCVALIPLWGIWGAAAARLCGQWGMGIAGAVYLTQKAKIRLPIGPLLHAGGSAAMGALLCFWMVSQQWVVGGVVAGGAVYGGGLLAHPWVRETVGKRLSTP